MDLNEIKPLIEQQHKDFLDVVAKQESEIKKLGVALPETKECIAKMNARLDELEIKGNRTISKHLSETLRKDYNETKRSAFELYMRKGFDGMPEVTKVLIESDATLGGFFVVPEMLDDIVKGVILVSNIRKYAKIRNTKSNAVKQAKRTGTFSATWSNEAAQQTEATGLRYGMEEIPNHVMTAFQDISNEDLEDPMFDLAAEVNSEIAEQFGKAEGSAFVFGNGKGQPEGFLTNAGVATDVTGNATQLTVSGFINSGHNLKSAYAGNATWFLNRQSIGLVRQLVDAQGRPIWLPFANSGLEAPNGSTILGMPYEEVPDMPVVAANAYPIAIGDWKRAYLIVDRISISTLRDPYSQSSRGLVRFLARKRVGGQVILAEAIRKLQVHT